MRRKLVQETRTLRALAGKQVGAQHAAVRSARQGSATMRGPLAVRSSTVAEWLTNSASRNAPCAVSMCTSTRTPARAACADNVLKKSCSAVLGGGYGTRRRRLRLIVTVTT